MKFLITSAAVLLAGSASAFAPVATTTPRAAATSLNVWGDKDYLIAPSILSADFARLGEEVDNMLVSFFFLYFFFRPPSFHLFHVLFLFVFPPFQEAGADVVHFDVMDNHYVPNLTIGPMVCKALRDHGVTVRRN